MRTSPIAAIRRLHEALEQGTHGEGLAEYFTADATTVEKPNALKPLGAEATLEQMLANSTAGAGLLSQQRYDIIDAVANGDMAIVRLVWTGTIAVDVGKFSRGQELRAHIAQFVSTRDGRISRIETYDCYEPF